MAISEVVHQFRSHPRTLCRDFNFDPLKQFLTAQTRGGPELVQRVTRLGWILRDISQLATSGRIVLDGQYGD